MEDGYFLYLKVSQQHASFILGFGSQKLTFEPALECSFVGMTPRLGPVQFFSQRQALCQRSFRQDNDGKSLRGRERRGEERRGEERETEKLLEIC